MKKIFLLLTIILITTTLKAQVGTDLQFSQIVTLKGEVQSTLSFTYQPIATVPSGKVWKVIGGNSEYRSHNNYIPKLTSGTAPASLSNHFAINHPTITSNSPYCIISAEVYLNENETIYLIARDSSMTNTYRYVLQAIEYTVIP